MSVYQYELLEWSSVGEDAKLFGFIFRICTRNMIGKCIKCTKQVDEFLQKWSNVIWEVFSFNCPISVIVIGR